MKLFFCFIVAVTLSVTNIYGQPKTPPLKIAHLSGNFYIYTTYKLLNGNPFPSNSMYVVTDSGVVLIDTPWNPEETNPLLDSIEKKHQKKIILCVVTHYHDDRTSGLDILKKKGIKTYASQKTNELAKANSEKTAAFQFTKDTTFKIGGLTFETFYPGEGHTKDNIVIWFPKEKILYGGCFVKSTEAPGLGNIADADLAKWPLSIKKVMKKYPDPAFIIPGHQGWQSRKALKHTLNLLNRK